MRSIELNHYCQPGFSEQHPPDHSGNLCLACLPAAKSCRITRSNRPPGSSAGTTPPSVLCAVASTSSVAFSSIPSGIPSGNVMDIKINRDQPEWTEGHHRHQAVSNCYVLRARMHILGDQLAPGSSWGISTSSNSIVPPQPHSWQKGCLCKLLMQWRDDGECNPRQDHGPSSIRCKRQTDASSASSQIVRQLEVIPTLLASGRYEAVNAYLTDGKGHPPVVSPDACLTEVPAGCLTDTYLVLMFRLENRLHGSLPSEFE